MKQPQNLNSYNMRSSGEHLLAEIELGFGVRINSVKTVNIDGSPVTFDEVEDPNSTFTDVATSFGIRLGRRDIGDTETVGAKTSEIDTELDMTYPKDKTGLLMSLSHKLRLERQAQVATAESTLFANVENSKNMRGRIGCLFGTVLGISAMGVLWSAVEGNTTAITFSSTALIVAGIAVRAASQSDPTYKYTEQLTSDIKSLKPLVEEVAILEVIQDNLLSVRSNNTIATSSDHTQV